MSSLRIERVVACAALAVAACSLQAADWRGKVDSRLDAAMQSKSGASFNVLIEPVSRSKQRVDALALSASMVPAQRPALVYAALATDAKRNQQELRQWLDERGIVAPLREFLDRVRAENGFLHVSLDVDFLDPGIAPAVGTTVPGGTTFREAHLVMEHLHESGLVTSLDLVELNPFLDERGKTAKLMVELVGSLMGRKVFDRPTRSFG